MRYDWLTYSCNIDSPLYSGPKCEVDAIVFWIVLSLCIILIVTGIYICVLRCRD
ncbi:P6a protein [Tetterwort vein chlorosis virus]|uniref:p6a protein n=1 Tax=Tetterwort vein chlorosis virus TaxID=1712389 RepID=A0A0M4MAY6_9CLOS|nr:P6a protein [Tetterwort vein chlorosis virus]ALE18214.1 P6a protein [Tetterwort vein chlorosis virus]